MGFSRFVFLYIFLMTFLSSCQAETLAPTEQAISTDTHVPPTITTQPTATRGHTATPYPPLSPKGPYLLYRASEFMADETVLYMMDMEDFGRKKIVIPDSGKITFTLENTVSPDGQWLAYLTPNPTSSMHFDLNILNLQNENTVFITPLLSEEFPENQTLVANAMMEFGIQEEARHFIEIGHSINLYSPISWSPNGHYLAFGAQIDGPSTDIYLFELATGRIARLTDDLFNLATLYWSPDSEWIMFQNIVPGVSYSGSTLDAINVATKQQKEFGPQHYLFWQGRGWISNSEFLITSTPEGNDPHNLRIADVNTGKLSTLWQETYFSYAVDEENQVLGIFGAPDEIQVEDENNYLEVGYYLVSFDGKRNILSTEGSWTNYFRGGESTRFLGLFPDGVRGFSLDGSDKLISESNESLHVSPDYRWVIVGIQDGFELFDKNDQLVRTFSGISISEGYLRELLWRPDGQGFFVRNIDDIYYITLPDGEPILIEDCEDRDCWLPQWGDFAWLP